MQVVLYNGCRMVACHFHAGCHRRGLNLALVFFCVFCVVIHLCQVVFFLYQSKRLAWGTCLKWPILCRVGCKTLTQSISVYVCVCACVCMWLDRKEQSFQVAVSSWMIQLETAVGYKDGLSEALSTRCALLIQVSLWLTAVVILLSTFATV